MTIEPPELREVNPFFVVRIRAGRVSSLWALYAPPSGKSSPATHLSTARHAAERNDEKGQIAPGDVAICGGADYAYSIQGAS
jgi:hypothetical protein